MTHPVEIDENGDPFDVWLINRSYALLLPVCKMGLWTVLLVLCVADPIYYTQGVWSKAVPLVFLVSWHVAMVLFFGSFLLLLQRAGSHTQREKTLRIFIASAAILFVWFGVVSWLGTGDLSMFAMAQVLIAAVFCMPGNFRRWIYGLQLLALGISLAWLDNSGSFLGQMHFVNLAVIAIVAYAMDGYMLKNAQALFAQTCRVALERKRADLVLYNALPVEIADELKAHQRVKAQIYPDMSILFADIVGFTRFAADNAPEQVLGTLNELFSKMDLLVDAHRVEKIKTIGDAYMVVSKGDVAALAALALSMRTLIQRYNAAYGFQFSLRMGIHSGPTIAGVIGHKRFLYDVWGDAVNVASRMESSGEPDRIQTSEAVYQALRDAFAFEERGLVDIKGKGLLTTYFLLGPRDSIQPFQPSASGYTP